jgi:hypothetical protein
MGPDLRPADRLNPLGYFEDREFLRLNRHILASAGGDFIHPPSTGDILAQRGAFEGEIAALVRSREESCPVWGWKTTTTCLTLELFLSHLPDPRLVMVLRNPLAVARSQLTFSPGELGLNESLRLVATYYMRALNVVGRHPEIPVCYVGYEELLAKPRAVTRALAGFLELPISEKGVRSASAIVRGRWGRARVRRKLAVSSWRSLQASRLRLARETFAQRGARGLASLVVERVRGRLGQGSVARWYRNG